MVESRYPLIFTPPPSTVLPAGRRASCAHVGGCERDPSVRLLDAGATERAHQLVDLRQILGIFRGVAGRVVRILQQTGQPREVAVRSPLVGDREFSLNEPTHRSKDLFLTLQRHLNIHFVVGILLEVDQVEEQRLLI